jgi:hypothetical protein
MTHTPAGNRSAQTSPVTSPPQTGLRPGAATLLASALMLLALGAGCIRAHAKTASDIPLDVPQPPPRVIEPVEAAALPVVGLPKEPERLPPSRPSSQPRADAARADSQKSESRSEPQAEPARPADELPRQSILQTTPAGEESVLEREIRMMLNQATVDLEHIDYRKLNPDAQTQYNTAKRFAIQAQDAIRARNLVFARTLADKAASLAAQLAGR